MSGDGENKKRIAIIGVSCVLLVAVVVAVTVGMSLKDDKGSEDNNNNNKKDVSTKVKAIKSICAPTDFKQECEESLTTEAHGNTTDPSDLIMMAFNATIKKIEAGLEKSTLLHEVEQDPLAKSALDTCKELMQFSIDEFRQSIATISTLDFNNLDRIFMNLKVWLSAAITYQETCVDAFQNTTSDAGKNMKQVLESAMHMSSNGLAIITDMANALSAFNFTRQGRRLLQEEIDAEIIREESILGHGGDFELPTWFDEATGARRRLLGTEKGKIKPQIVVAKDGSGQFKSINEALKHVPKKNENPFVIYIREGVYHEYVYVTKEMKHVVFMGDGGTKTRITGNKSVFKTKVDTYRSCTVAVEGDYFIAIGVGFENSAGPDGHQAVALRVQADAVIFYKCQMDGYQDTLYAHAKRQFYRDCVISGTIDFIFGDADMVMQNCTFVVRKPMENQACIVTAQGRKDPRHLSAIIIQGGSIVADPEYRPVRFKNKAYLARPWKEYSKFIVMETFIDDLIQPDGFLPWDTNTHVNEKTCFYAEHNNKGPGADKSKRVKWAGIKTLTHDQVAQFMPGGYFKFDNWIRYTRIPYSPGTLHATATATATH